MRELVTQLLNHDDILIHIVGWSLTIFIALATMLHKGVHKRISLIDDKCDDTNEKLNQLIGAHNATHSKEYFVERREDPERPTLPDYPGIS